MGVSSIGGYGSYGFSSYTTPLNSGPTAGRPAQEADQTQQLQAAEESRESTQQQSGESRSGQESSSGGGNVTATRGQNLNITV